MSSMASTPTNFAVYLGSGYLLSLVAGSLAALFGYACDFVPWVSIKYSIITILVTYGIVENVRVRESTQVDRGVLLLFGGCGMISLFADYWWSLGAVVSLYIAARSSIECLMDTIDRHIKCDQPREDIDPEWMETMLYVSSHIITATMLFRGKAVYHHMFSNVWDGDWVSYLAVKIFMLHFCTQLILRWAYVGLTLESVYDSFFALREGWQRRDGQYLSARADFFHCVKRIYREYSERVHREEIAFDTFPVFDYDTVPVKPGQVRLLYIPRWTPISFLFPGLISGSLVAVPEERLTEHGYEALSYTWGPLEPRRQIIVNDSRLEISSNLYELLHARRSVFYDRVIWVDALCIDQGNNEEKETQLSKMRDIYLNAHRVVAWLGDPFDASMAVDMMVAISNRTYVRKEGPLQFLSAWDRKSPGWKAFMKLVESPYFKRAWIFQESGLGYDLQFYIGGQYIRPDIVYDAIKMLILPEVKATVCAENGWRSADALDGISSWQIGFCLRDWDPKKRYDPDRVISLGLLLSCTVRLQATRAVDKVYALQGISNSAVAWSIVPDYESSAGEVFRLTAQKLLESEDDAEYVLPHAGIRNSAGSPSWAPDWEMESKSNTALLSIHVPPGIEKLARMEGVNVDLAAIALGHKYAAGGSSKPSFKVDQTGKKLQTEAAVVATILHTTAEYDHLDPDVDAHGRWLRSAELLASDRTALARTLVGNRASDTIDGRADASSLLQAYTTFRETFPGVWIDTHGLARVRSIVSPRERIEMERQETLSLQVLAYGSRFNNVCGGRKLCRTTEGLGVVPTLTRSGDVVCVIRGLQTPYVMRPCRGPLAPGLETEYELVGECYADGFMDGKDLAFVPIIVV